MQTIAALSILALGVSSLKQKQCVLPDSAQADAEYAICYVAA